MARGQPAAMETNVSTDTGTEEVAPTQGEENHLLLSADTNGDGGDPSEKP